MKDFLTAFFSGLSDKEKKVFYAACIIVCLALFDRMIIGPIAQETAAIQDRINSQTGLIKKNLLILGYKDKILKKYEDYNKYFSDKALTQEERIAVILNDVEGLADTSGIALTNINPVKTDETSANLEYKLTVECLGTMASFMDFIYNIDKSESLMRVQSFTLTPKDRETYEVKSKIVIEKLIVFPMDNAAVEA
ncbi:MAG: hypothetical protein HQL29_06380 [Candidatus Omnitrophica bacterium]|nr:hypothetical protein [Candidatus Omnitrophota bacterium]